MKQTQVFVLKTLVINAKGEAESKNVGVTFNIHDAEAHRSAGVENEFDTFEVAAEWEHDAATTEIVTMMREIRETVEERCDESCR
jgi:hypothetical protein